MTIPKGGGTVMQQAIITSKVKFIKKLNNIVMIFF